MINGIRKEAYLCEAYAAGKSMEDVMEEYGLSHVIKLGSNENSYGPYENSKKEMVAEINKLNVYPEKNFIRLKNILAERFGVDSTYVGIGHGAGGVLETIARTFLEEGDEVLLPMQSYRLYREVSKVMGATVKEISLNADYTMDLDAFKAAITDKCKIIWICNPNNPTGSVMDISKFEDLLNCVPEHTWVVLDEAYAEFAPTEVLPDTIRYIKEHKNLLCVRTFSKYYALAGGRVGYVIADPEVITYYDTVSEPFNANRVGLAGAVMTLLKDQEEYTDCGNKIIQDRERINQELADMGCTFYPSYANFVFFSTPYKAAKVSELLLRSGVIIRPCGGWGYVNHIRMTVGTTAENDVFLKEMKRALEKLKAETMVASLN